VPNVSSDISSRQRAGMLHPSGEGRAASAHYDDIDHKSAQGQTEKIFWEAKGGNRPVSRASSSSAIMFDCMALDNAGLHDLDEDV
jgi:hypothetical protein